MKDRCINRRVLNSCIVSELFNLHDNVSGCEPIPLLPVWCFRLSFSCRSGHCTIKACSHQSWYRLPREALRLGLTSLAFPQPPHVNVPAVKLELAVALGFMQTTFSPVAWIVPLLIVTSTAVLVATVEI